MKQPVPTSNVVPLRATPRPEAGASLWSRMQARLFDEDAATYGAWFHPLTDAGMENGQLTLAAPSRFHARYVETHLIDRLHRAARIDEPSIVAVTVIA